MPRRNQGPRLRWLKKRSCYYINWTEGGRSRQRSTGTASREQAEIFFAEWLAGRQRSSGPRHPSEVLVTDVLTEYADEVGPGMVSPERASYAIPPLATYFEGRRLDAVTPSACRDYAAWRARSSGTVRRELGGLRAALNHAHREMRVAVQIPVVLPQRPPPRDRWLTRSEVARLLAAARSSPKARFHLPLFILVGLYTGKRKEAILSLRWPQVDLAEGIIDWETPGRRITNKRRGRSRINPKLAAHLARAKGRSSDLGYVISYAGRPVKDIKKGFAAACEVAGLEGVTPHVLRHTCATWLMQRGVSTWEAAGYLGMSEETLLKVYGHHHPDHQRSAASAF